jgi:hypothetical protein
LTSHVHVYDKHEHEQEQDRNLNQNICEKIFDLNINTVSKPISEKETFGPAELSQIWDQHAECEMSLT